MVFHLSVPEQECHGRHSTNDHHPSATQPWHVVQHETSNNWTTTAADVTDNIVTIHSVGTVGADIDSSGCKVLRKECRIKRVC